MEGGWNSVLSPLLESDPQLLWYSKTKQKKECTAWFFFFCNFSPNSLTNTCSLLPANNIAGNNEILFMF